MAVASAGFRWLDALEKEFDKSLVDLDLILGELEDEDVGNSHGARQRLAQAASCFSQMAHKAQTVFQTNARQEAEVMHLRAELGGAQAARQAAEAALEEAVRQLHKALLDVHSLQNGHVDHTTTETIRLKLEAEFKATVDAEASASDSSAQLRLLEAENQRWKAYATSLHADIYGARLAAKYLEKELAGRIQQMQLLGRQMQSDVRDKLWDQLEAEIQLHRHKVLLRACRDRRKRIAVPPRPLVGDCAAADDPGGADENQDHSGEPAKLSWTRRHLDPSSIRHLDGAEEVAERRSRTTDDDDDGVRTVLVRKATDEGLGLTITGGREHHLPVVISELHRGAPADLCGRLAVGDVILSVNDVDLTQATHDEAVRALLAVQGNARLRVQLVDPSPADSEDDEVHRLQYEFFADEDAECSTASQPSNK